MKISIIKIIFVSLFFLITNANGADYFSSKIYNNNASSKTNSTFTILEKIPGYSLDLAKKKQNVQNIFIVINGQQTPCGNKCTSQESDKLFGRQLTGIHRISKNAYQVYLPHVHNSLAGTLYDQYSDNSIIIDILNPKYDWGHNDKLKKQTEFYVRDIVKQLLHNRPTKINLFIVGFSRGALLAYKLAQDLKYEANIKALVTIDPVINPLSSDRKNIATTAEYKRRYGEWKLTNKKLVPWLKPLHFFPVLKNPHVPTYNVFQRQGLFSYGGGSFGKPIGSAIEGALSPCKTEDICALFHGDTSKHGPFDQYDSSVAYHSPDMPQKYVPWALEIALKTMPLPEMKKPVVLPKPLKPIVKRIYGRTSLYTGDRLRLHWRANQGGLEYQHTTTPTGQKDDWSDWAENEYSYTYNMYDAGHYSFKVRARNKVGDISPIKTSIINIKHRPPHFSYIHASARVGTPGMTISYEWKTSPKDVSYQISFIQKGKKVIVDDKKYKKDSYSITLYDQGDYIFHIQAFSKEGIPSRRYSRVLTITDYIYPDEVLIGEPPFNPPANPFDPKQFNGIYAVAKLLHTSKETQDNYWEGNYSITTPDWERDKLVRSPWAIKKSMPARIENLKVGQTIVYSGWNPAEASEVRGAVMKLATIDDLSQVDDNIVGASWPNIDDPSQLDKKKLYLHNIRVCLEPENCLIKTRLDISLPKWSELLLEDYKGHLFNTSSALKGLKALNLFDNKLNTCWAEDRNDTGVGEVINFTIPEKTIKLNVANGYQKSEKLFYANNRVKQIKYKLLLGINHKGEVSETKTLYHTIALNKEQLLALEDSMGMQSVNLKLNWNMIETQAKAFTRRYESNNFGNIEKTYILQCTLVDTYKGSKYNDTCISEIGTVPLHPTIQNIYTNKQEDTLLIDTDVKKGIILEKNPATVLQIIDTSKDKQWVIVLSMASEPSDSRAETHYALYNTWRNKKLTSAQLGTDIGELYSFEYKDNKILLEYLNTSTGNIEEKVLDERLYAK